MIFEENKMNKKLQPLPKNITDDIRAILEGIRDGKLEHNQSNYHCGTAHCVAGWKAVLDYDKDSYSQGKTLAKTDFREFDGSIPSDRLERFMHRKTGKVDEWYYALHEWSLTESEANKLFHRLSKLDDQFRLLERLESGERLKDAGEQYDI